MGMSDSVNVNEDPDFPFEVKCRRCGSLVVSWCNSLGYSETSGVWGDASFTCEGCKCTVEMVCG